MLTVKLTLNAVILINDMSHLMCHDGNWKTVKGVMMGWDTHVSRMHYFIHFLSKIVLERTIQK